jgi:anti-sigma regulatory factor (Ser/Thr protein kinase)
MKINVNSDPRLLGVLRAAVKFRAREGGFADAQAEQVALAVHEAAANVIRHTYQSRRDGRLDLEIQTFPDRMEFVLEDSGPKMPAETLEAQPSQELRAGGLGTQLMRQVMDTCALDEDFSRGNRLRMVKRFPPRGSLQ